MGHCSWIHVIIAAYLGGVFAQNDIYCVDPHTGLHYPVNSTWPSTTFCGTYTCNAKLVRSEDATAEFRQVPIVENNVEAESQRLEIKAIDEESNHENDQEEITKKNRRGDIEIQESIEEYDETTKLNLDENDITKLLELYRVASELTEAVQKAKPGNKLNINLIDEVNNEKSHNEKASLEDKPPKPNVYDSNYFNAFYNQIKNFKPGRPQYNYNDYINYLNQYYANHLKMYPYYSPCNFPQVYNSPYYRANGAKVPDCDGSASNIRDFYFHPYSNGMPQAVMHMPESPEAASNMNEYLAQPLQRSNDVEATTELPKPQTLSEAQMQQWFEYYEKKRQQSTTTSTTSTPDPHNNDALQNIANLPIVQLPDRVKTPDLKYYAYKSEDPRMDVINNNSRVFFFYYNPITNTYAIEKAERYEQYEKFYNDFMSKYPNASYFSENDPHSQGRLHYSQYYNKVILPPDEILEKLAPQSNTAHDQTGAHAHEQASYEKYPHRTMLPERSVVREDAVNTNIDIEDNFQEQIADMNSERAKFLTANLETDSDELSKEYDSVDDMEAESQSLFETWMNNKHPEEWKVNPFRREFFPEMRRGKDVMYKIAPEPQRPTEMSPAKFNPFNSVRWPPELKRISKRSADQPGEKKWMAYITVQGCPEELDLGLFRHGEDKFYPHCCPRKITDLTGSQ